jgi:hypothetical protein
LEEQKADQLGHDAVDFDWASHGRRYWSSRESYKRH